jgi:protein-S-isoprenylcysteine O-methyltransferase Ste14
MPLAYAVAALAAATFVTFAVGTYAVFRRTGSEPRGFQGIKVGTTVTALLTTVALIRQVPPGRAALLGAAAGYVASLGLFVWTARTARAAALPLIFSGLKPRAVLTTGPYRLVPHPFYLSYALAYASGILATRAWWVAVPSLAMIAVYAGAARRESAALRRDPTVGPDYGRYRARSLVRRVRGRPSLDPRLGSAAHPMTQRRASST